MQLLEHKTESRRSRAHKQPWDIEIPKEKHVGPRGGVKDPQHIVWKTRGYGLGTTVWRACSCAVLYPYVRYLDGSGTKRLMPVDEWVKATGKGKAKHLGHSDEFKAQLKECNDKKELYGARTFEIVKSILDQGGTLTVKGNGISARVRGA